MSRAANIPVQIVRICGHSLAYFIIEGRYLGHGDNPYNSTFKATGLPAADLLIDEATYSSWFGANPDNHNDNCSYIGHQIEVLSAPWNSQRARCSSTWLHQKCANRVCALGAPPCSANVGPI